MPDDTMHGETRLDAALAAMRELPDVARDDVVRVAARAVLADTHAARVSNRLVRAAAVIAIVAISAATLVRLRTVPASGDPVTASVTRNSDVPVIAQYASASIATAPRPIVFELDAPAAHSVQVLGDFNDWSRDASSMQRGADGRWRITTLLPPGRYVYTFLVDGRRFTRDPARDAVEDRDFGVTGSEVVVGEAP
ncbi:MAG TPA: isoamylase early set domain-containing protein [Gemmatimonadaceae bacterium]|nr:isoamylase early set domain-containing protein [Gemmatimonadaceae bacterium]